MTNGTAINTTRKAGAIPEGVHRFKIVDYEEREGPKGAYWAYTMEVEENSPFDGQNVWTNISLSDAARWKLEEFLDALQIDEGVQITGDAFLGQCLRGEIVHDEYTVTNDEGNKETRRRSAISTFLPDSAGVPNPEVKVTKTTVPAVEKAVTPSTGEKEPEPVEAEDPEQKKQEVQPETTAKRPF